MTFPLSILSPVTFNDPAVIPNCNKLAPVTFNAPIVTFPLSILSPVTFNDPDIKLPFKVEFPVTFKEPIVDTLDTKLLIVAEFIEALLKPKFDAVKFTATKLDIVEFCAYTPNACILANDSGTIVD